MHDSNRGIMKLNKILEIKGYVGYVTRKKETNCEKSYLDIMETRELKTVMSKYNTLWLLNILWYQPLFYQIMVDVISTSMGKG